MHGCVHWPADGLAQVQAVTISLAGQGAKKPMIISGGTDATIRVWDLDRIIRDMKWSRRYSEWVGEKVSE